MPHSTRGFRTSNLDRQFHKVGVPCDIAADNTGIGAAETLGPAPQSLAAPVAPAPQPPPPAPLPVPPPSLGDDESAAVEAGPSPDEGAASKSFLGDTGTPDRSGTNLPSKAEFRPLRKT